MEDSTTAESEPAKLLNTVISGSASPFGDTSPAAPHSTDEHGTAAEKEKDEVEEEADEPREKDEAESNHAEADPEPRERKTTLDALPPSPPLTRPASPQDPPPVPDADAETWHPLARTRDSADLDFSLAHAREVDPDATLLNTASTREPLRVATGAGEAAAPTPWENIDPPEEGEFAKDAGSGKGFAVLQKGSRARARIPHSSYYFGPPPVDAAYGTHPVGHIGVHHPREVFRIERDYTGGELVQFSATYPLELEGRITHTQFLETVNAINEILISAHSIRHSFAYNVLAVLTLQASRLVLEAHYDKVSLFPSGAGQALTLWCAGNAPPGEAL
ncbi:hypothetical protein HWV62_38584 [Athelia sp. TMB]|nr:hypothetical protein HWV62_38584 [Athelia sp. TMB]